MRGFLFILIAFLSVITACNPSEKVETEETSMVSTEEEGLKRPPALTVVTDNHSASAVLGSYSWTYIQENGTGSAIESDSGSPTELVEHQKSPINLKYNSDFQLHFKVEPIEYKVRIWENGERTGTVSIQNNSVAPHTNGSFIYEVSARWKQGTAMYAFLVNVN
ncbi:hypothetical protein HNQ94_001116 [Salirhabdus euzebyi]|uniref:Lipoprotein n=1 Tax=Salirhabdus euzebyi TaxID=394506 RepID=A0A841PV37_9BACI|nr:hypothetical protein [Salirhabdus euzebyi]MBB6452670.1 hypothetical protein [Salirhabdus euzebyi]